MSNGVENVLGDIPVIARLALGTENIRLLVTTDRIIVAHVGKRGTGALATSSTLGRLGGALEDIFKGGKESMDKRRRKKLSLRDVLKADKDNFAIGYDEIVTVDVEALVTFTGITILTRDDKFEFFTRASVERVVSLLEGKLGTKLAAGRT